MNVRQQELAFVENKFTEILCYPQQACAVIVNEEKGGSSKMSDFERLTSVDKALAWMQANSISMEQLDMIAQDEFTHDLLVPWRNGWLVFGLT